MKLIFRIILFLIFNFAALGFGSIFTQEGVSSDWYMNLEKAPWTPPGWVFGFAWSSIMICYAIFMARLWSTAENQKKVLFLYLAQWILNFAWNPTFFYFQQVNVALLVILSLTALIAYFFFHYKKNLSLQALWITPYLLWLILASSLNAYILVYN